MIYPWQQPQWQQLLTAYNQNRLSHAYLLSGSVGLGKTDFANTFATFLLCEQPGKTDTNACGLCKGCQLVRAGTHPDFLSVTPKEAGHAIKIDQIRALTQQLTQKSQRGGYQVVVISPADAMPVGAANALLKTLEEPPGDVVILLVASVVDQLPATIASRCQQLHFHVADNQQAVDWLSKQLPESANLSALLTIAGCAPLAVQSLYDADYLSLRDEVLQHLLSVMRNQSNPITPISQWVKKESALLLYALITIALDISRLQWGVTDAVMNHDAITDLEKIAALITPVCLQKWIKRLLEKKRLLLSGINLNQQLLFEGLLLDWSLK